MRLKFVIALLVGVVLIVSLAVLAKRQLPKPGPAAPETAPLVKETSFSGEAPLPPLPPPATVSEINPASVRDSSVKDRQA